MTTTRPRPLFMVAERAVADIKTGQTIASTGVIGWVTPDALLRAIADRFVADGTPRDLTFYFPVGTGDAMRIKGMDHVAKEGLMARIVSGSFINPVDPMTGRRPELMRLIREDRVEAYNWPIGATMHWLREVARRGPGYLTKVGLGTFADPRHGGGRLSERTFEDLVRVVEFDGEEYLFYPTWPIDVALIRASSSDSAGNLSWEDEPLVSSSIAMAIATKACGGTVIAQVRRVVGDGDRPASQVQLPGHLVDRIVVEPDMAMTTDVAFDPAYLSAPRMSLNGLPRLPMSLDRIITNRVAQEVRPDEMAIYGFGAATDVPLVMAEQGRFSDDTARDYLSTTEHGAYGGIVMPGWQFSANVNPDAIIDGLTQFDVIDGGLCPFAALSFAEFDSRGFVNVTKFGAVNPGTGGFTDIAHNSRRMVFAGSFTTGGLDVEVTPTGIKINSEGKFRKFVAQAQAITYRVSEGVAERQQEAMIVTERAVFRVCADGLELIEIAPGINLQRDVLDQMDFSPVRIADPLPEMPLHLFTTAVPED